jgi:hypothetical protein
VGWLAVAAVTEFDTAAVMCQAQNSCNSMWITPVRVTFQGLFIVCGPHCSCADQPRHLMQPWSDPIMHLPLTSNNFKTHLLFNSKALTGCMRDLLLVP